MKIFLDANILYSAARAGGLMERFVTDLMRKAECCTNLYAIDEARRNLEINDRRRVENLTWLTDKLTCETSLAEMPSVDLREKDRPIICGAIAAGCSHLLTGDRRDFGSFFGKLIEGVKIVSPEMLAVELGLRQRR